MNVWFSQTIVQDTGWTLVHFLWQGAVIAGLLAGVWRVMRRTAAHYRYLAGCAAMLLMAVAPLVTFRLVTVRDEPPALSGIEVASATQPPVEIAPRPASAKPAIIVTATPVAREAGAVWRVERIFPWLVAGWLLGVVALSGRLLAGWWEVRRLRRESAQTLGGHWQEKMAELARRLGIERPLRLLESALVEVPTVIGWLRPVILLPATCLTGLSPAQLEAILAHELAHIRRHDYLVNLLQSAVETLLFYHPAVWWVSRRVREERENCCDDLAVGVCGDRVGYARALATLEELRLAPAQVALAAAGAPLLQRVRRLLGQTERSAGRPAWPVAGIIAVLLAAVFAAGMRNQPAEAAQKPPVMARTNAQAGSLGGGATNASNATARAVGENTATNRPAAVPADLPERIPVNSQSGMYNWSVDGQNQLNQQWFWYRVGSSNAVGGTNSTNAPSASANIEPAKPTPDPQAAWRLGPGRSTWSVQSVDEQNRLSQQWFWYRVGSTNSAEATNSASGGKGGETNVPPEAAVRDPWGQPYLIAMDQAKPGQEESARQSAPTRWRYDAPGTGDTNSRNGDYFFATGPLPIISKLNSIRVESVKYPGVPLREILTNLKEISQQRDPNGDGINFLMDREEGKPDVGEVKVNVDLTNVRLTDVLDAIVRTAERPIKYSILDYAVVFSVKTNEPVALEIRTFRVDTNTFYRNLWKGLSNVRSVVTNDDSPPPAIVSEDLASRMLKNFFVACGVDLSTNTGKAFIWNDRRGTLTVRATAQDLDLIEAGIQILQPTIAPTAAPVGGTNLSAASARVRTEPGSPSADNDQVRIAMLVQKGKIALENGKLDEAETMLKQALISDPQNYSAQHYLELVKERRATNERPGGELAAQKALVQVEKDWADEQRRQHQAPNNSTDANLISTSKGRQEIIAKLNNIRVESVKYPGVPLREVLNDLAQLAKNGDPNGEGVNFFVDRGMPGPNGEVNPEEGISEVKISLALNKVRLSDVLDAITKSSDRPLKFAYLDYAVVFSLRAKKDEVPLEVRTFHVDANTFEQGLQSVAGAGSGNGAEDVSARVRRFCAAAGVDIGTNTGKAIVWNERKGTLTVRATAQDLDLIEAALQTIKQPSAQINLKIKFLELAEGTNGAGATNAILDMLMKAGMVIQLPGSPTQAASGAVANPQALPAPKFTGTLTDAQYRAVLKEMEKLEGAQSWTTPEVTTENGRQAQVQAFMQLSEPGPSPPPQSNGKMPVPVFINPGPLPAPGTIAMLPGDNHSYLFGPVLDVIPYLLADGFSVQMTLMPSVTEFVGYDTNQPSQFIPEAALPTGQTITSVLPLPHFRVRQVTNNVVVWDGQTVVIGGLMTDSFSKVRDQKSKKKLLIFITPTLVNPDGSRVHAEGK